MPGPKWEKSEQPQWGTEWPVLLQLLTAAFGPKRRIAATQQLGRNRSEADIGRRLGRVASGAHDPMRRLARSKFRIATSPYLILANPVCCLFGWASECNSIT
jgi:hypothetical protein